MAADLTAKGAKLEIEQLTTGQVSLECLSGEDILSSALCANGPDIEAAVDDLIRRAHARLLVK